MEFFERAHVPRKGSSKKENKAEQAVKKQLKQILDAYKKGNNQEIKNCGEKDIKYDIDDVKSVSEFSDFSFHKDADTSHETISSRSSEETQLTPRLNSNSNEQSSSKSNITDSENESLENSLKSITDDLKSQSTSRDISTTFDNSSIMSEGSSIESDISIPSSLRTSTGTGSDISDAETFDPDGILASKILEKLGDIQTPNKRRKLSEEDKVSEISLSKKNKQKETLKNAKKEKKNTKKTPQSEEFAAREAFRVLDLKDKSDKAYETKKDKIRSASININSDETVDNSCSSNSSPFISVLATDIQGQSLSDIVGDYVHSTVKNLPSQKQHIVFTPMSKYAILDEVMSVENAEDISSVIPEIDEELDELTVDLELPERIIDTMESVDLIDEEETGDNVDHGTEDTGKDSFPIKLYNGRDKYILVMKHPVELYVHGKVRVTALGGSVTVFGYTLHNESVNIFAPYCYFAHSVKTIEHHNGFHGLFWKLTSAGLTVLEAEEIVTTITDHDAVICLNSLDSPNMDFIDSNFTATELFNRKVDQSQDFLKRAAENLGCSLYLNPPKRFFEEKSTWEEVVESGLHNQSRGIVCGGKSMGKSTFLRYYINRLLANTPVLVIDLDPGQAEFTVPGNISVSVVTEPLIGPNFTHLRKPERTLNIGMINSMDNSSRYISAVSELITHCKNNDEYQSLPWIVNTMGMCNNIGLKFITAVILQLQPTFLFQIDSRIAKKRFEYELQPHMMKFIYNQYINDKLLSTVDQPNSINYTFIKSVDAENTSPRKGSNVGLSPKDERYLNVLAYFSELVNIHRGKGILEIVPYEVDIRDLNIGVNVNIPQEFLTKVINGKIIALCQLTTTDKGKMFTLGDNALLCHGYGLIRGIDFKKGLLYILTPVHIEDLNVVNALVYSDWMPDLHGLDKELPDGTTVPYRIHTSDCHSTMMSQPRRRFNPLQLLKVTRST